MEYTQKSVSIPNRSYYTFRLGLDDIHGIIRLTANNLSGKTLRITDRSIPITTQIKWDFHNSRSGYSENGYPYTFTGSYITRDKDPYSYKRWKDYIVMTYKKLKMGDV